MNKTTILFFGFVLISAIAFGQNRTQQRIEAADNLFEQRQYYEAIDVYERVFRREDSPVIKREVAFKIGESYRMMLNYRKAKQWYNTALTSGYDKPIVYLHISEMMLGLEEFDNSIEYAKRFLEYEPENERGLKILESAKYSKENYDRETIFEVTYEGSLSSDGEEWGVAYLENYIIFHDDPAKYDAQYDIEINLSYNNLIYWARRFETPKERIVFASTRLRDDAGIGVTEQQGYSNIYQVMYDRQEGDWERPTLAKGGINSDYYDGFLSYDKTNQIGYFMNCGGVTGERETCDIYWSEYNIDHDTWGDANILDYNTDEYNIGYPSINENGDILYFASDNPEGHGGYDLYKIRQLDDGSWGEPENLGSTVNTPYNDAYPFIAGNVLYFSSFGHPGMGNFDIFYSIIDDEGNFSKPQNMGAPINSSADDFGFVISDDYSKGFFTSNRPGGTGSDDLYSFRVITRSIALKGEVLDAATYEPIANLDFTLFGDDGSMYAVTTDASGRYEVSDLPTDINYEAEVYLEGYEDLVEEILVKDQLVSSQFEVITEYNYDIYLFPEVEEEEELLAEEEPEVDEPEELVEEVIPETPEVLFEDYGMPTIYFDFAKYNLRSYSKKQLDSIVEFLNNHPDQCLIIRAHTDEIAGHLYNFYLSQERAFSAMNYLIKQGIDENRLYPSGYGKMDLMVSNAQTDAEHQMNRRANFEPIEKSKFQAFINEAAKHSFRYLNSLEKDVYFATNVEFMVQFVATHNPVHPRFYYKIMDKFPDTDIIYYYDSDRFHRYLVGSFKNFTAAYNMMRRLREMEYDTYIVAFNNGERISVSLAQSLLEKQK